MIECSEMQASQLSSFQVVPAYSEAHERAVKKAWKLGCWKMVAKLNIHIYDPTSDTAQNHSQNRLPCISKVFPAPIL